MGRAHRLSALHLDLASPIEVTPAVGPTRCHIRPCVRHRCGRDARAICDAEPAQLRQVRHRSQRRVGELVAAAEVELLDSLAARQHLHHRHVCRHAAAQVPADTRRDREWQVERGVVLVGHESSIWSGAKAREGGRTRGGASWSGQRAGVMAAGGHGDVGSAGRSQLLQRAAPCNGRDGTRGAFQNGLRHLAGNLVLVLGGV